MLAIGIDIGGTKIAGALVNESGEILNDLKVPTPATDPDAIVDAVVHLVAELGAGHEVLGVGVAAAGFIDADQAEIIYAPNLSWRNEPFKQKLQQKIELPILIENDANAAAWAEYRFGAGRGYKHMIMLTIGTGVGGAVIANSKMLRGGYGIAGELGHIRMVPDGQLCGCGSRGCLESYASGTALLKNARRLAKSGDPKGRRLAELEQENGKLKGEQVYQAIVEGDEGALELLAEVGTWLGSAISSLTAVLDPEIAVIGGGVSQAGNLLLDPIRKSYLDQLPARGYRPELKITTAEFVNDAGVVGAADLIRLAVSAN
jgi:glucokinase